MARNIRLCDIGVKILKFFLLTSTAIVFSFVLFGLILKTWNFGANPFLWITTGVGLFVIEFVLFWIGIIMVYVASLQLGFKTRLLGIICGWIPIVNLFTLMKIIRICSEEVALERRLLTRDLARKDEQVCRTRYPILLVHGVFFRDFEHFNYWGRIPKELEKNGATLYYGEHNSAAAVADSAKELEKRILDIVHQTGCGKVNIIAHSKGGLDSRLLNEIPEKQQQVIAEKYNSLAAKLGDRDPDFLAAVYDLTSEKCRARNEVIHDDPRVFYQSVGSVLQGPSSGQFPLNFTYNLVKYFDGENDGLVGDKSFSWGASFQMLRNDGAKRGISHGDMIDLNRQNINGFDVREFYVQLVSGLKERGF